MACNTRFSEYSDFQVFGQIERENHLYSWISKVRWLHFDMEPVQVPSNCIKQACSFAHRNQLNCQLNASHHWRKGAAIYLIDMVCVVEGGGNFLVEIISTCFCGAYRKGGELAPYGCDLLPASPNTIWLKRIGKRQRTDRLCTSNF
jgi:hypothetical protein